MLNTENQQLSDDWRQILTKTEQDTCIFAPRQSGKTTALLEMFLETPNSIYVTINDRAVDDIKHTLSFSQPQLNVVNFYDKIISSNNQNWEYLSSNLPCISLTSYPFLLL